MGDENSLGFGGRRGSDWACRKVWDLRWPLTTSRIALITLSAAALVAPLPAYAANINVASSSDLVNAINNAAAGDTITFTSKITLNTNLPQISKNVTINGGGFALDGNSQYRAFSVTSGAVAINNLTIANTVAKGGGGGNSQTWGGVFWKLWGGGGGGGAGLGGGLFVGSSASVTVTNVSFTKDQAIGGAGGTTSGFNVITPGGGGGGGRLGDGSSANSTSGYGGNGGPGGGGNGGTYFSSGPTSATAGGFGGGGGGGEYNGKGQAGGFGGGGGGSGNFNPTGCGGCTQQLPAANGGWGGSNGNAYTAGNGAGLGGAIFVQQGGTLTFGGPLTVASNTTTGGSNGGATAPGLSAGSGLFLQGNGSFTFAPGAGQTQTVSDVIADQTGAAGSGGSWAIVKNGGGTTVLTGKNQYTGGITVNSGVLQGDTSSLLGNVVDNASLVFDQAADGTFANAISGSGSLTKSGAGILTMKGAATQTGATTVNGGVLALTSGLPGGGSILLNGGQIGAADGASFTLAKNISVGAVGSGLYAGSGGSVTASGVISGGQLTKGGAGTVTLTGVNTFDGASVTGGVLRAPTDASFGKAGASIVLNGGSVGTTTNTVSNANFSHNLTLAGNGGVDVALNPVTWSGVISGTGQFIKSGTGQLQLTANNTYSGGTLVNGGTLWVAADAPLGATTGGVTLANGGALRSSATFATARGFTLGAGGGTISVDPSQTLTLNGIVSGGALTKGNSGTLALTGANTYGNTIINGGAVIGNATSIRGNVALGGSTSVTFDQASDALFGGAITGGGSLLKTGAGQLTLSGANTYSGGTTVSGGGLVGTTQSLQGAIVDNALVAFAQGVAGSYSGVISGSGNVQVSGAGSVKFTGDNTYTGLTTVYGGGTLLLGSSTSLPTGGAVTINGGAIGVDGSNVNLGNAVKLGSTNPSGFYVAGTAGSSLLVSGVVSGGQLTKTGAGTATLNAINTFDSVNVLGGTLLFTTDDNLGKAGSAITVSGGGAVGTTNAAAPNMTETRNLVLAGNGGVSAGTQPLIWAGGISGSGQFVKSGAGPLQLTGLNTYTGGTLIGSGTLIVGNDSALGQSGTAVSIANSAAFQANGSFQTNRNFSLGTGSLIIVDPSKLLDVNGIVSGYNLTKIGGGTLQLDGANTYAGNTLINQGTVAGSAATIRGNVTFGGIASDPVSVTFNQFTDGTFGGAITGRGSLLKTGKGALDLTGANTYTGGTTVQAGTLQGNSASLPGNIANQAALVFNQGSNGTYAGNVSGSGTFTKIGSGKLLTTGAIAAGGGSYVQGGTLSVNGSLTSPQILVDGPTSILGGNGDINGNVKTINGGRVAPGNSIGTLIFNGSLTIDQGRLDMEIAPGGKSDKIILTGPKGVLTFGVGTLNAIFEPGLYSPTTYTLVTTSQGVQGSIDALATENLPPNFIPYAYNTANDVYLKLTAALGYGDPLSVNQQALTGPLDTIYNATGVLPSNFANIYALNGSNLGAVLNQASGEAATGLRWSAVQMTNQFLSLMLDPFVDGRGGVAGLSASPFGGFFPDSASPSGAAGNAASLPTHKMSPATVSPWTAWAAAYGGAGYTGGDPWGVGSHSLTDRAGGVVAGLDYHANPNTVFGLALAGGGTNWQLGDGLGGGNSEAFQVGVYGASHWGPMYVGGALSFTNHWASTDRNVLGENLTSNFNAQSYGARVETGYRVATAYGAISPYVAGQAQSFNAPSYAEQGYYINSFALGYGSTSDADERSELGLRYDAQTLVNGDMTLAFRGKVAWAHDWFSNPALSATFLDVPGASFVVAGATPSRDLALISAGLELQLAKGISLQAKFETELGGNSTTYAGAGTMRYAF